MADANATTSTKQVIKVPIPAGDTNLEVKVLEDQTKIEQVAPPQPAAAAPEQTAPTPAEALAPGAIAQPPTRQELIMAKLKELFVKVEDIPGGSFFVKRGLCTKCGWQSMQHTEGEALTMVMGHVGVHWKDVANLID